MNSNDYRGVLSSFSVGCEPVCDMVSKLLKDGYFFSDPYHPGIGYMFRKKPVPKLVFVFANEYDNQHKNTYKSTGLLIRETVVIPGMTDGTATMYSISLGSDVNAPDPYCLNISKTGRSQLENYLQDVGIVSGAQSSGMVNAATNLNVDVSDRFVFQRSSIT